jgi:delta-aminolevulinic acid dehydratase/porphobilinogen synthase
VLLDDAEGADIVMVKPAGLYLDIIREVRDATRKPVAAYQISGEYAQIHAAARLGWLDLARCRARVAARHQARRRRPDPDSGTNTFPAWRL